MVSLSFPIIIRVNALVPALYSKARPHGISVDSHLPTPSEFVKIKLQISSLLKQAAAEMSALCFLPFSCCFPLDSLESHPVDVQLGVIQGFEGISYADLGDFLSADASFLGILPQYPAALATLLYPLVSFFFFLTIVTMMYITFPGLIYNWEFVPSDHIYPFNYIIHDGLCLASFTWHNIFKIHTYV